ncbi:hybrid-cluster NAD(P)-dependent oxidoreductase [Paroceanicella profunda]|nr:hybrid-cluster NAD(P)-dependent oxidoreductase [Paroceanicella profunda]
MPRKDFKPLDARRFWTDAQELECTMILPEAPGVKTFCFKTTDDSWFKYFPGQFITIELPTPGEKLLRTYTLSSSPSRPLSIAITVKAQRGSLGSQWMLDHVQVGDRFRAYGPGGLFTFHNHPAEKYLFISAGSGITPMMSMTRWLYDDGAHTDITFVHAARRPSDIIFRAELERMAQRLPDLHISFVIEEDDPYVAWTGYRGRLSQLMLPLMAPDYLEREIFCCGPAPFMQEVRDILHSVGFDMEHYHEENFLAPVLAESEREEPDDVIPDEDSRAAVIFAASGVEAACRETDTVLAVAKAAGLNIPSACQFGVCGTCKVRKLSGEVHMVHNGGISDDDIASGHILACCSNPIGRVEVDV